VATVLPEFEIPNRKGEVVNDKQMGEEEKLRIWRTDFNARMDARKFTSYFVAFGSLLIAVVVMWALADLLKM
jgi:hypothetical protein